MWHDADEEEWDPSYGLPPKLYQKPREPGPDEWRMADGKIIKIISMEDTHLVNTYGLLKRSNTLGMHPASDQIVAALKLRGLWKEETKEAKHIPEGNVIATGEEAIGAIIQLPDGRLLEKTKGGWRPLDETTFHLCKECNTPMVKGGLLGRYYCKPCTEIGPPKKKE